MGSPGGRLDGKVVLITATAVGMGRVAAQRFAAEGARVIGYDLKVAEQAETVALVRGAGGEMTGMAPGSLMAAANPLDRVGEPDDVARLAAFLASDDASYVNGAAIPVDGGRSIIEQRRMGPAFLIYHISVDFGGRRTQPHQAEHGSPTCPGESSKIRRDRSREGDRRAGGPSGRPHRAAGRSPGGRYLRRHEPQPEHDASLAA